MCKRIPIDIRLLGINAVSIDPKPTDSFKNEYRVVVTEDSPICRIKLGRGEITIRGWANQGIDLGPSAEELDKIQELEERWGDAHRVARAAQRFLEEANVAAFEALREAVTRWKEYENERSTL